MTTQMKFFCCGVVGGVGGCTVLDSVIPSPGGIPGVVAGLLIGLVACIAATYFESQLTTSKPGG